MKKKYFFIPILFAALVISLSSCIKEPPSADFSASELNSSGDITFSFSDNSSNSPNSWFWTFEGGYPSTSTERNPTVTYSESGIFDVTLEVSNNDGNDETTYYNYINIVQFNNPLFTDMYVTVGDETKTMYPDSYVQFAQTDDYSFDYYAETYGETTGGTIIGEELYWDQTVDLGDYSSFNLILNDDFIFFFITNPYSYVDYDLDEFWVNYGDYYDETVDYILIPCDGVRYGTGYYYTNYGMEVRAYYRNYSDYELWTIYPSSENNQYKNLIIGKSVKKVSDKTKEIKAKDSEMLYPMPELNTKHKLDPNAKDLAPSNNK